MTKTSALIYLETRAGTTTESNIAAIASYPLSTFNINGDNIQFRGDMPFISLAYGGSLTEGLRFSPKSATNAQQPQVFDRIVRSPIATANLEIGLHAGINDFRSNTLKNVATANEDVTCGLVSSATTSEVCYAVFWVTDMSVVDNSVGARIDVIQRATLSGTVNTTLTNFELTSDNQLKSGDYRIIKADVLSRAGANNLLYSEFVLKGLAEGQPCIPRTDPRQPQHTANFFPMSTPLIFNSDNNYPSINLLAANSATNDIDVTLYLQRVR